MDAPAGPGVNTTFPDDPLLFPIGLGPGNQGATPGDLSSVQQSQLDYARQVTSPGDRSMALERVARAAIFSNQLSMAHTALVEASAATAQEPVPLIHDQRLIAIVTTFTDLAEAHLREGKVDLSLPELKPNTPDNGEAKSDRTILIRRANAEWQRGAIQAGLILDPTYRSEYIYRVVDNMGYGSQTIINDFPLTGNPGSAEAEQSYAGPADQILRDAAVIARRIERPVWRDRALVSISAAAGASKQFARGLEVARMIPQPEVRTDALVRIAEAQARRDDPQGATITYREAAKAVASIPLEDPRAVLAGVLIDNLISVGRFDDARATIVLYPDTARRLIALGAIAESQGWRGAADSARTWIARDMAPQYHSELLKRVNNGVLKAIRENRSRDLSNRER
jgi:hypothetical protein